MDSSQEAEDYDAMDHAAVNGAFCEDLLAEAPDLTRALDVGTGTALIPIDLCTRAPWAHVTAVDMAEAMLAVARRNVERAGLQARIVLEARDAKATGLADGAFQTVFSNSLVHHVPDTVTLLREMRRLVAPGGLLFVRDLARPADGAALDALVEHYAKIPEVEPPARAQLERQRAQFAASLHAALTLDEVLESALGAGLHGARALLSSDRHFTLVWTAR